MSYKIWKRERYKNLKVKRLIIYSPGWSCLRYFSAAHYKYPFITNWQEQNATQNSEKAHIKRHLNRSVHNGISNFSSEFFHPRWRKAGKRICQLHLYGHEDEANNLDPQPQRLGITWYIY
jgi:hypothetical protein